MINSLEVKALAHSDGGETALAQRNESG